MSTSIARTRRNSSSRIRPSSIALLGADLVQQVGARPRLVVGGELGEVAVVDGEQAGLFEVRHRDAPATLQVDVELVLDRRRASARSASFFAPNFASGRGGEVLASEAEGGGDGAGDLLVGEAVAAGGLERAEQRAA